MNRTPAILIIVVVSLIGGGAASNVAALSQHRRNPAINNGAATYSIPHPVSFREVSVQFLIPAPVRMVTFSLACSEQK